MQNRFTKLRGMLEHSPQSCGCYFWKKADGEILYVGKARDIRKRLQSYLRIGQENPRIAEMLEQASSVEWLITERENEALLLEANLIKRHKPRFNIRLKDDKRYPYLCISISETYPQIFLTRRVKNDKDLYFGPYADVKATRQSLYVIHKIFPIRKVRQKLPLKQARRPCMNFFIKRCLAPCQGTLEQKEYRRIIDEVILFLEGNLSLLESLLQKRMQSYSAAQDFEKAAIYRDMIYTIRKLTESQFVQTDSGEEDILGLARYAEHAQVVVLEIREGRLIGRKSFPLVSLSEHSAESELIEAFIRDYYVSLAQGPRRIQLPLVLANKRLLEEALEKHWKHKIRFFTPRSKQARSLKRAAQRNAEMLLRERLLTVQSHSMQAALADLRKMLNLAEEPLLMECYDISHIQGSHTVASTVVFKHGRPHRPTYRHYRVRSASQIDDPASMKEIIGRRLIKLEDSKKKQPQIFLIDGGAAQVNAAYKAALEQNKRDLLFIGLAKKHEELYFPLENKPHQFDKDRPGMRLLRQMRNEAHRFALEYHRKQRQKHTLFHSIEEIKNIGAVRKKALLRHFSHKIHSKIEKSSLKELNSIPGIGPKAAQNILTHFQSQNSKAHHRSTLRAP